MADKKKKGFIGEFKEFIMRGNVIDLAVGVIIGAAFQGIINSLVKDMINPLLGKICGGIDFSNLFIPLSQIPAGADQSQLSSLSYVRDTLGLPVFAYGSFITAVLNFLIMALVIFFMVRLLNRLHDVSFIKKPQKNDEEETEPQNKECPMCLSEIPYHAKKCRFCGSDQPDETEK